MKFGIKIIASAFLLVVVGILWVWLRTNELEKAYMRVQKGDSQARVVELCGKPGFISTKFETNLTWEDSQQIYWTNGKCIQEFHYFPPLSICGESWQIGFDDRTNVVSKFHFISP